MLRLNLPAFTDITQWRPINPHLGSALFIITASLLALSLYDARVDLLRSAEKRQNGIALTLERQIQVAATSIDLSLAAVVDGLKMPSITSMDPQIRSAVLFNSGSGVEGLGGIAVFNELGELTYGSSHSRSQPVNVADRSYFIQQRDETSTDLLVSGPLKSKIDDRWTLVFSRRLTTAEGAFAGIAVGALHLSFFEALFESISVNDREVFSLINDQVLLVARRPLIYSDIGRNVETNAIGRHMATAPAGSFSAQSVFDGINRVVTYRKITGLPLTIAVAFSEQDVYGDWLRNTLSFSIVLSILLGLDVLLRRALQVELRRRAVAERTALLAKFDAEQLAVKLNDSVARLDALVSNMTDAAVVTHVDGTGTFTYESVNPVWERMTGIAAAVAIGRTLDTILIEPMRDVVISGLAACVRSRNLVLFSFSTFGLPEAQHWEAFACPIIEADGSIARVISVARSVTEQRRLEQRLRRAHRLEGVGELTAGIAHDFNNLLQAMMGGLEVSGDISNLDESARSAISVARDAANRCASLVHQLLAFSRQQVLAPQSLSPAAEIEEIAPLIRALLGKQHVLVVAPSNSEDLILADKSELSRCLLNLSLNARDASPAGSSFTLYACCASSEDVQSAGLVPGNYVRFVVEDNGSGMSAGVLELAFQPFYTTKGVGKGTGLGLSMVQGFARQSGGDVAISSRLGVGTSVSLYLPRAIAATSTAVAVPSRLAAVDAGKFRILVVDDEESVRRILSIFLSKSGHTAVTVDSGKAAIDLIEDGEHFDLLITDQSMPEMTGVELIEQVAKQRPAMAILLITGFDMLNSIDKLGAGLTILRKPFERAIFLERVKSLLTITDLAEA